MTLFELEIIYPTQSKKMLVGWVHVDGEGASFLVGPNHLPLISILRHGGVARYKLEGGQEHEINLFGGVIRVSNNRATIILDS